MFISLSLDLCFGRKEEKRKGKREGRNDGKNERKNNFKLENLCEEFMTLFSIS